MAGSSGIVLQDRERRLLDATQSLIVFNRDQAMEVAGYPSIRRANQRLRQLVRAGLLRRTFIGSHEAVYWLAGKPARKKNRAENGAAEPAALFIRHRLEINRVHLLVQYRSIPVPGWWFGTWQSFSKPLVATVPLIPDGYFEVGSPQGIRAIFVEVDLGTEAVPVLARKASLYVQLAASGGFTQIFRRNQFRVLIITTSERRLQNIRQAIAKVTDKLFWLGTLDLISAEKFWTASWHRPTGDQLQSIL